MFGRRKTSERKQNDTAPVAAGRVFSDDEADAFTALWRLTALPREEFDATYGDLLCRCWRCIANVPEPERTALRERTLQCTVAALKVRQAHVLPRFAAAEDSSRLAEVMSFALAACVVAERLVLAVGRAAGSGWCPMTDDVPAEAEFGDADVPRSFGALVLPRLIGPEGHEWLGQQPEALLEVAAYFGAGPSELRRIADDAASRVGMPVVPPDPVEVPAGLTAMPAKNGIEGDAPIPVTGSKPAPTATPSETAMGAEAPGPESAPADIGDGRVGWQWFNWARAGLRDGSIRPNAEGGWLYNIDGSAYVVDPDAFEALAAAESLTPKSIRNRVLKLGRHNTRRSSAGRGDAFSANLVDGRRVSGMVFPGELFWDQDPPPASASALC